MTDITPLHSLILRVILEGHVKSAHKQERTYNLVDASVGSDSLPLPVKLRASF